MTKKIIALVGLFLIVAALVVCISRGNGREAYAPDIDIDAAPKGEALTADNQTRTEMAAPEEVESVDGTALNQHPADAAVAEALMVDTSSPSDLAQNVAAEDNAAVPADESAADISNP